MYTSYTQYIHALDLKPFSSPDFSLFLICCWLQEAEEYGFWNQISVQILEMWLSTLG